MTTLQEALPCPFCGKQNTLQVISGQELMGEDQEFWQHSESFGVVCDASTPDGKGGCGAMCGFKPTEDEAIEAWNTRSALAQQGEPVAWYEYNSDMDAWFLAYGHNPRAKTRPLVFGDTAAPAPAPQPVQDVPEVCFGNISTKFLANGTRFKLSFDTRGRVSSLWNFMDELDGRWVALVAAEDDCHLQSAQPVAQPIAKTCDTCAHYQQGKHPGVSIHEETCYECRSYWGNKWEAKR